MATNTCSLDGPVPFKDVDDSTIPRRPRQEYNDLIATLPSTHYGTLCLRCYHGTWWPELALPGNIAIREHFVPRHGDVLLASYPKSGTTWLKAMAFATMARARYDPLSPRHPLLRLNPHDCVPFVDDLFAAGQERKLDALPSPRILHTHTPYSVLTDAVTLGSDCKIIYVCRDPKDVVVSYWHFVDKAQIEGVGGVPFAHLFESFCEGTTAYGPIWEHVLGYWKESLSRPDKVLFLKYEEIVQDPKKHVRRLAEFVGRPFSDEEEAIGVVDGIVKLCSFEKLKGLDANRRGSQGLFIEFPNDAFFRKGVVGDWRNHMTQQMARRIDDIFRGKFGESGLPVP